MAANFTHNKHTTRLILFWLVTSSLCAFLVLLSAHVQLGPDSEDEHKIATGGHMRKRALAFELLNILNSSKSTDNTLLDKIIQSAEKKEIENVQNKIVLNTTCLKSTVIFTHSHFSHFQLRETIRHTWGNYYQLNIFNMLLYFIVGLPQPEDEPNIQALWVENERFGDILHSRVPDDYKILTDKTIFMLEWAHHNCPNYNFVVKTDDDVYLNIAELRSLLEGQNSQTVSQEPLIGHAISNAAPIRDIKRKYNVPFSSYNNALFPTFLSGSAYVIQERIVFDLLSETNHSRHFELEDVYVTGILREKLGLELKHNNKFVIERNSRTFHTHHCDFISLHSVKHEEMYILFDKCH